MDSETGTFIASGIASAVAVLSLLVSWRNGRKEERSHRRCLRISATMGYQGREVRIRISNPGYRADSLEEFGVIQDSGDRHIQGLPNALRTPIQPGEAIDWLLRGDELGDYANYAEYRIAGFFISDIEGQEFDCKLENQLDYSPDPLWYQKSALAQEVDQERQPRV